MKSIFRISAALTALALTSIATQAEEETRAEKNRPAKDALIGVYKIVSGWHGEEKIPEERLEGAVRWGAETIAGYDNDENKLYAATYTLDTDKEPWVIHLVGTTVPTEEGAESQKFDRKGLVKKEGDRVTLIYALEKGDAPDDFEPGANEHKFVFEKTGEETGKAEKAGEE